MEKKQWYKDAVVYQIWPRSFCDGNGDGIGDLWGVLSKLDYIKSLGVDVIWFSPLYPSPNEDYGYDIADYRNISPDYGDLDIFKKVLDECHKRGMKVIMDLVVNHTSRQHEWFLESQKGHDNPYHDYYFWRKGKSDKKPPNNWLSTFDGDAWEYNENLDEYYLHIFAKGQPDLNHDNPKVREEVKDIMRFWLDMGVDGFREDVITWISKAEGLPNGIPIPVACGLEHYTHGPHIHEYLLEYRRDVLDNYDCFVVGEAPMMTPKAALPFIEEGPNQELDMMFHFQHMEADCFMTDPIPVPFSLKRMKKAFSRWQYALEGKAWNALYLENHDHPRIISRYGSEAYHAESGKMLAAMYMLQKGTPFVYQGQEFGMTDIRLPELEMYEDVSTYNAHRLYKSVLHMPEDKIMNVLKHRSRDNGRTPVQWSSEKNAGFTTADKPWFYLNENYWKINAADQEEDPDSLLNFYRKLIKFRKKSKVVRDGSYKEYYENSSDFYCYERVLGKERMLVICSFSDKEKEFTSPAGYNLEEGKLIFANYGKNMRKHNTFKARPYELRVYYFGGK
ncbi:MAG: alpha-glucosidase [Ruminococcaceae bacterium]|nr:alpha-glucosidase [Oscillospiraceae bacterium]